MKLKLQTVLKAALVCLIPLAACKSNGGSNQQAAQPPEELSVLSVQPRTITVYNEFPANIQGKQTIEIRPKIDGYIEKIYVDEGATVRKGQALFHISAPQYEQEVRTAQADINIAQADVNAARMQVEKVRPLVEKDIISRYELQSAEYTLESKQAALSQARAKLANARTNLGYTTVTSPVDGVMGTIPYRLGSLVSSNTAQPLTTVANIGNFYAYFSFNEKQSLDFTKNTKGANMQQRLATLPPVTLMLADGSEYPEKGKIETASGLVNTQTGSVSVRATFTNPGNFIQSGSTGKVRIPQTIDSALLIPQKATYELQGKRFVYIVNDSGTVTNTQVTVIETSNGQYFIATEGIKAGDKIAMEGIAGLRDGMMIKPKPLNADSVYSVSKL